VHWNFDTIKEFQKSDLPLGIDRWVDHKWKESLVFDFGRYGNRFAGVNQLSVVF
jgi:hypothetical protein